MTLLWLLLLAQQVSDTGFRPPIEKPAYAAGAGPVVAIDEAHRNFHTKDGRYATFANLLERDGYRVMAGKDKFTAETLKPFRVLVIANALSEENEQRWQKPVVPGFTAAEVAAVDQWVREGGSLWMMIDHFPMPGIYEPLAKAFGATFLNGYAIDQKKPGPLVFSKANGLLKTHAVTAGVDAVATFTGSAFRIERGDAVLEFGAGVESLMVERSFEVKPETERIAVKGWLQGAVLRHGRGRVAIFGEAAMFSAQLAGPNRQPMGMNAPSAKDNPRLLRNIARWLTGGAE